MLYGVNPMTSGIGKDLNLKPVMSFSTEIVAVHDLQAGDTVGYGGTWRCPESMKVGVAAVGYGDGYPRHIENGTPVLINDNNCEIVGRVSMDLITIDLRGDPNACVGDKVLLWGDKLPAEKIAACAETIAYELFCNLTNRVKFSLS